MIEVIKKHKEIDFIFWGQYQILQDKLGSYNSDETNVFINELLQLSNVTLKGPVAKKELVTQIKNVHFFWICYNKINSPNWDGSNSHKILEYLATGKPVISHFLETYQTFPDLILMNHEVSNENYHNLFNEGIKNLNLSLSKESIERRIKFAHSNSYSNQIEFVEGKIKENLFQT